MMNRKSYIQFHLALFSLTMTDSQRSIKSICRPSVHHRTSTFSFHYFSYIFYWILLKLGTVISWVSLHTFLSEFYNFDFLIFLMNFHNVFVEIATFTVLNGRLYVRGQRFLRSYGSISLKLCTKKVKQIFNIIQNGGLAAKHTWSHNLENVTWISFKLGSVRLYRRGATCMPLISCCDKVAIFTFLPPILRVNPTKRSWYRPVVFCSSSNCFTNFYTFSAELYRPTGLSLKVYDTFSLIFL